MFLGDLKTSPILLLCYGTVVNVTVACGVSGTFDHPPYNPRTFVVIVTVYKVLFDRLALGSIMTVLPSVCSDTVVATGPGVNVILVLLTAVGSRPMDIVTLIVLLIATPVAIFAGSEDDITKAGTFEANLVSDSTPAAA
jgi:hypothetical protein